MSAETAYHRPSTVPAVHRRLDEGGTVIAGGQTLSLLLRRGDVDADALVDVSEVPALSGIDADGVSVGPTTTYHTVARHELSDRIGVLGDACGVIGDRQIRQLGTVGGAVCHAEPALDILPPLLVLGATVRLGSLAGRRTIGVGEFLVGDGQTALGEAELLEAIRFDRPGAETGTAYETHATVEGGWATAGVAARLSVVDGTITDARVALAGLAETTIRAPSVERELAGEAVTDGTLAAASERVVDDANPRTDRSGSATYKRRVASTLVERGLRVAASRAGGGR